MRQQPIAKPNSGIVLLIVLGILALMSVLAVSFVSMARLERSMSTNYVLRTRALFAAESGVEYALVRLHEATSWADLNEMMRYNPDDPNAAIEDATQPSFMANVDLDKDGVADAVSGVVGSSNVNNGDYFRLKVTDVSGRLNLNDSNGLYNIDTDPYPDADELDETAWVDNNSGVQHDDNFDINMSEPRLYKIFLSLLEDVFGSPILSTNVATAVFDYIELHGRIETYAELRRITIDAGLTEDQYELLMGEVTLHGWQDPDVLRPTFRLSLTVDRGAYEDLLPGIPFLSPEVSAGVYFFFDWQTKGYEREPRSPVHINSASVSLLTALIEPLQGWFLQDVKKAYVNHYSRNFFNYTDGNIPGWQHHMSGPNMLGVATLTDDILNPRGLAEAIYERVHAVDLNGDGSPAAGSMPDPFSTWNEFETFLRLPAVRDFLTLDVAASTDEIEPIDIYVDLLLANFNPNSRLNDFNPDRHRFRHIDKAQLTKYSTEFSFEPTGTFEIVSLGIIEGDGRALLAHTGIDTVQEIWKTYRHTTQAQFMKGFGVQTTDLGDFFSKNKEGLLPTAGASVKKMGYTVQSYPEPDIDFTSPDIPPFEMQRETNEDAYFSYYDESVYDGSLSLASYRLMDDTGMDIPPRFICNFDRGIRPHWFGRAAQWNNDLLPEKIRGVSPDFMRLATADMAHQYVGEFEIVEEYVPYPKYNKKGILNANQPTTARLTNTTSDPRVPGILHPDGALSDAGRTLSYRAANIGRDMGQIGTVEFWVKPNWNPNANRQHSFLDFTTRKATQQHNEPNFSLTFLSEGRNGSDFFTANPWSMRENVPNGAVVAGPSLTAGFVKAQVQGINRWFLYTSIIQWSTPRLNQIDTDGDGNLYGFSPREWSHIVCSWDYLGHAWSPQAAGGSHMNDMQSNMLVMLNGQQVMRPEYGIYEVHAIAGVGQDPTQAIDTLPFERREGQQCLWLDLEGLWNTYDILYQWTDLSNGAGFWFGTQQPNYMRFGSYCGAYEHTTENAKGIVQTPNDPSDDFNTLPKPTQGNNFSMDATIANVIAYDEGPYQLSAWKSRDVERSWDQGVYKMFYEEGRYLSQVDNKETAGEFTSQPIDLSRELKNVFQGDTLTLRSVHWTVDTPRYNRDVWNPGDYADLLYPDYNNDGKEDPISIDLGVHTSATSKAKWVFKKKEDMLQVPGGSVMSQPLVSLSRGMQFSYRVTFNLEAGQTLFESPVLDDITFIFTLSKPKVFMWRTF